MAMENHTAKNHTLPHLDLISFRASFALHSFSAPYEPAFAPQAKQPAG